MKYDFDKMIDRCGTDSLKYDFAAERGKPDHILPLWVADMDFQTPPCVIDALIEKSRHGIFGYSDIKRDYFDVLQNWFASRFDWNVCPEWLVKTPGVVYALNIAIRALTKPDEAVLIQQPVYYPFSESILANGRKLVVNQLVYDNDKYTIDFTDFDEKISRENVKLFLLCSPHNPVGRVWTHEELARLGEICQKHGVIVVSDEIHADFTYPGHKHHVFANVESDFTDFSIICTAPTKTFNLAGLQISNIFIPNANNRQLFRAELGRSGYSQANIMGLVACRAAYSGGGEWLDALLEYLAGNIAFLRGFLCEHIPQIRLVEPEGTYLAWLDCSGLGLDNHSLENLIVNRAGLWLDGGTMFGAGGSGFQRVNIACPRAILEKALERLEKAVINRVGSR
jgi:cystathionine beta-lyase